MLNFLNRKRVKEFRFGIIIAGDDVLEWCEKKRKFYNTLFSSLNVVNLK